MGEDLVSKVPQIWGLNDEGEINGVWRDCGLPNFYYMMGRSFLTVALFHLGSRSPRNIIFSYAMQAISRSVASTRRILRFVSDDILKFSCEYTSFDKPFSAEIKAKEEGLYTSSYDD